MLNTEQQAVVDATEQRILCLAGAGTGKTHCMIARINALLEKGVSPSSFLVLTFTNAAAVEMEQRFKASNKFHLPVTFTTFHAFCYKLLIDDPQVLQALGYIQVPQILSDSDEALMNKQVKAYCGLHGTVKANSSDLKEQRKYEIFERGVTNYLKSKSLITFDRLSRSVCELFKKQDLIVQKYHDQYKYIFVDEFQDTDPVQAEFVFSFKMSNIFVVGDALQAIYDFRNADSTIIKSLASTDSWTTYQLNQNYRSDPAICDFANNISTYADKKYRVYLHPTKYDSSGTVELRNMPYIQLELISNITHILNTTSGTTAILCRTNWEASNIQESLVENGYETTSSAQHTIPESILQMWSTDERSFVQRLSACLTEREYAAYLRLNITTVDAMTKEFPKGSIMRLVATVNAYKEQGAEDAKVLTEDNPVYVGTIHSVKGLEYDNVILVGVGGRSFPLDSQENNNLYYVAVTRAKHGLYIFGRFVK